MSRIATARNLSKTIANAMDALPLAYFNEIRRTYTIACPLAEMVNLGLVTGLSNEAVEGLAEFAEFLTGPEMARQIEITQELVPGDRVEVPVSGDMIAVQIKTIPADRANGWWRVIEVATLAEMDYAMFWNGAQVRRV